MNGVLDKFREFARKRSGDPAVEISGTGQVFVSTSSIATSTDEKITRQIEAAKLLQKHAAEK